MDRKQIISRVQANTGRTDKDDIADQAIDEALVEAGQAHEFKSMQLYVPFPFAATMERVTLPSDAFQVVELRVLDGVASYTLELRPKVWVTRHYPNSVQVAPGRPIYCYEETGSIVLLPVPDRDYDGTLTFIKLPSLDGDADLQPRELASYVVAWATSEVYRSTEQFDNAAVWDQKAQQRLVIAIKADNQRGAVQMADRYPDPLDQPSIDHFRDPFYGVKNTG